MVFGSHEKHFIQLCLISYTILSPFIFLLLHKIVLKEKWDWDMADGVTLGLYLVSNICASFLSYQIQECGK